MHEAVDDRVGEDEILEVRDNIRLCCKGSLSKLHLALYRETKNLNVPKTSWEVAARKRGRWPTSDQAHCFGETLAMN